MPQVIEPLSPILIALMYFGDVVFALSGALAASRNRMDVLGVVLIGIVTGIGGGTLRDVLLNRPVWWVHVPTELLLCAGAALVAYVFRRLKVVPHGAAVWADALGLAAFGVVGAHVALQDGVSLPGAVFLGMLTATGGGVIRDLLTQTRPMILTGEVYATAALVGAGTYAILARYATTAELAGLIAFAAAFGVRAGAIVFRLRLGVGDEPLIPPRHEH